MPFGTHSIGPNALLIAVMLGGLAAPVTAVAIEPSQIEGRWKADRKDLVLDISACGTKFCGQLVTGTQCGATVLAVSLKSDFHPSGVPAIVGNLDLPAERGYKIRVLLDGKDKMTILGGAEVPSMFQRSFPLLVALARIGDASCPARATS